MDAFGNKAAATEISGIKVAIPNMALRVIDRAIQVHGGAGVTQYTRLAEMYAQHAHVAHRRRTGRGAQDDHRTARDPAARPSFRMNGPSAARSDEAPQAFMRP